MQHFAIDVVWSKSAAMLRAPASFSGILPVIRVAMVILMAATRRMGDA